MNVYLSSILSSGDDVLNSPFKYHDKVLRLYIPFESLGKWLIFFLFSKHLYFYFTEYLSYTTKNKYYYS